MLQLFDSEGLTFSLTSDMVSVCGKPIVLKTSRIQCILNRFFAIRGVLWIDIDVKSVGFLLCVGQVTHTVHVAQGFYS